MGAFADDIAVVLGDFWLSAPALQRIFVEFHEISALALNAKKTVMIPLWPYSSSQNVGTLVKEFCAEWADFKIDNKGKYLGFLIGPGALVEQWKAPLFKFESRVKHWAEMHLGMAMNIVAFNVYIALVLEFTAQLLEVDDAVRAVMRWAMRRLASGPGTWVTQRDLENQTFF